MSDVYVALDIETTGLNPDRDAIIEIGAVKFRGNEELDSWASLINPRCPLPVKIQLLTGIKPQELSAAPSLSRVARSLIEFVGSHPIVGHNVSFDLRFLNREGLLVGHPSLDTFELASILMPEMPNYGLGSLMERLRIGQTKHHRALDDARAAKELFVALVQRALDLDLATLQEINRLAANTNWALRSFFLDIQREKSRNAFVSVPGSGRARSADREFSFGKRTQVEEGEESLKPAAEGQELDVEALAEMLSPGGLFAQRFPGYEYRPQQVEMLRAVAETFNSGGQLLVEGGTGTGKSMAYLLPAIYYAWQNGKHVVISTNTINLQDQLYNKDIPDLKRILPISFKAALLKGRSNYLCRRRFAAFRANANMTEEQVRVTAKILAWLPVTETGDQAELTLMNTEFGVWQQVQAEAESCLGERCSFRQRGLCFLYRARQQAEAAHLIVVNHALLLSDVVTENRVLPEYEHLIIDEAHHLEDQATEQLGFAVSQLALQRFFNELSSAQGVHQRAGFLSEVAARLHRSRLPEAALQSIDGIIDALHEAVDRTRRAVTDLFAELAMFLDNCRPPRGNEDYDLHLRVNSSIRTQPAWSNIETSWDSVAATWRKVTRGLEALHAALSDISPQSLPDYDELLQDVQANLSLCRQQEAQLESFITNPAADAIYWAQVSAQNGAITLHMAPLHVAPLLQKHLFDRKETVILTSATLCSGGDFSYIRERLGLPDADELQVGSPFDYAASTLLYLPTDIPEPNESHYQRTVEKALAELCRATGGRTLALFTSYSQLLNTYRAIAPVLEEDGIVVYAQGVDGSRRQLLENFKTTPRAVLLGTRSFWEGIDVVGEALSCLVIARLPFSVPSDPVFSARAETFEEPFTQYSVPDAVLRFRQGFGRLIRSTTDRGVVVVMDKRVLSKFYGPTFLRSLPECTVLQGPMRDLPAAAKRWLEGEKRGSV